MVQVKTFYAYNDLRNFSYLILDDVTGESWVIDPYEAGPISEFIKKNGLNLRGILNTHQHFDHIRGNEPLADTFGAVVRSLQSGETVRLSETHSLETLATPGHTNDHQVFFLNDNQKRKALFSGDTLFNAGVGNCKNGGNVDDLFLTTMKLKELPSDILLYPGHDYIQRNLEFARTLEPENVNIRQGLKDVSEEEAENRRPRTLEEELRVNPFFRLESEELRNSLDGDTKTGRDLFKKIRSLRDHW